jgi:hypothetical protein
MQDYSAACLLVVVSFQLSKENKSHVRSCRKSVGGSTSLRWIRGDFQVSWTIVWLYDFKICPSEVWLVSLVAI